MVIAVNTIEAETLAECDIIVVGAGPVGQRFVETVSRLCPFKTVRWFGNEPWRPYDRIKLSPLLGGDIPYEAVFPDHAFERNNVEQIFNCAIVEIDRHKRCVIDEYGKHHYYKQLVLATGSSPHIPSIPGVKAKRVYTFRNLKDVASLQARSMASRHTIVIGAGLLGLEAARAMLKNSTEVTVVQQAPRIMNRQLDDKAASILQSGLEDRGLKFELGSGVRAIICETIENDRSIVSGVRLQSGKVINCDTVIVCAGIKPNVALASYAKLSVSKGVKVNSNLQTTDANIYAVGECAQFEQEVVGLVGPGLEQAAVAAFHIAGKEVNYKGYISAAKLKVAEESVFSVGDVQEEYHSDRIESFSWRKGSDYRKIYLRKGVLIGALSIGEWSESFQIQEYVRQGRRVGFLRCLLFKLTGNVFDERNATDISTWSEMAVVCNCKSVSRQAISEAFEQGYCTTQALAQKTGASMVCGSCKPLLDQFTGDSESGAVEQSGTSLSLMAFGLLALVVSILTLLMTPFAYSDSVQNPWRFDLLWIQSLYKQISGFSILALCLLAMLLSLSKRWNGFRIGKFVFWRNFHASLGLLCLLLLMAHTGLHFGVNLNQWLMANFIVLSLLGGVAAFVAAKANAMPAKMALQVRRSVNNLHLLAFWPFPVLLGFHIVSVYYF